MDCPRCGSPAVTTPACPRCGVIVAKARPMAAREERIERWRAAAAPTVTSAPPADTATVAAPGMSRIWFAVAAIAVVLAFAVGRKSSRDGTKEAAAAATPAPRVDTDFASLRPPAPAVTYSPPPSAAEIKAEVQGLSEADRLQTEALVRHVNRGGAMTASDVSGAEALFAAHPEERTLRDLLEVVLLSAAYHAKGQRNFAAAAAYLRRAAAINPASTRPLVALVETLADAGDWTGAEAAARAALVLDRSNMDLWRRLGYALLRQDRNREAAEVLRTALEINDNMETRALLAEVEKGLADEKGMTEQRLAHFNVRYDGGEHEAVGREILRALERHYATLAVSLDHQPAAPITVILLSRETYNSSAGPAWSAGVYSHFDGRIRIPIGGLTASLTPEMDSTLIHELTHAFNVDRSRGIVPREVAEGLAQYMEGERIDSVLTPQQRKWLADGRFTGVHALYLEGLSFVEYLVASRGMGGMNELMKAMGETGDVDKAFQRVHGGSYHDARKVWAQHLRQQYGS